MKVTNSLVAAAFLSSVMSATASANLIQNGGFEDIGTNPSIGSFGSASTWQIYSSLPNWSSSQGMEVWTNDFIVPAYEGNNIIELNAHPGQLNGVFSIWQAFDTTAGQQYELTFAGRKRQKNANEAFQVSVGDLTDNIYNQTHGVWNEYSYVFTALASTSTLSFLSLDGGKDTTGNLLDSIKVTAVPEPTTLALLGLGLAGLGFRRKTKSR